MVASEINETNEMSGSKSLFVDLTFNTTKYKNFSPVLDTQRMSAIVVQNRLNSPTNGTHLVCC